mgnify:CR=1 FL=1
MASPSKNQNYAYLIRLSTQKLLELLAAAPAPAETPEDKAYIDAIVEVVLEREERHPTGLLPDPEQAWEEFQQYYNTPEGEDLWEELRRLPEKDRTVLHLYYYEDMTTEEIAQMLDRNPATVRSQLLRARAKLKKLLVEEG